MTLRARLLILVLALLVPMTAFAAITIVWFGRQQRAAVRSGAVETARALMNAIDQSIGNSITTLVAVASLQSLGRGDLAAFHQEATRVLASQPEWRTIILLAPDGRQLVNVLRPIGEPLPGVLDRTSFDAVLRTHQPVVGNIVLGPMTGQHSFSIRVPVLRGDELLYVLTAAVKPASLVPVLGRQRIPDDWVASVFDRDKRIVARTRAIEQFLGRPVSPDFVALLDRGAPEGWQLTRTLEGEPVETAYSLSQVTGWGIGLGIPSSVVAAPLRRSLVVIVAGGLGFIAVALLLALVVGRRITAPIVALAAAARAFGERGELTPLRHAGVTEVDDVRRAFEQAAGLVQSRAAEAEAANRAKDEFLAILSHELRTPLNAVLGWARMLQGDMVGPEASKRALDVIVRNASAQVQLIDDLLDVSRVVSGKMRLDVRSVDLEPVVRAALESIEPAAAAKDIRVHSVLDPNAGPVVGDPDRLQQVLWNLLINAVKFTPKGGRVQVRLQRVDSHVELVVSDTGQGIEADVLPLVFDRFRQADSSSTRAHRGLGLGLSLVRHLVELHGGSVSAHSDGLGKGSTFVVRLPLSIAHLDAVSVAQSHGAIAPAQGDATGARLDGLRILAVDDDQDAVALVAAILGGAGAVVRTCLSAGQAFDELLAWKPDVLVSDIEMPGEDGYALIRRVRELDPAQGGRIAAVALTAYGRAQDRMRSLTAGYNMHVPKPVDPQELTAIIASLWSGPGLRAS